MKEAMEGGITMVEHIVDDNRLKDYLEKVGKRWFVDYFQQLSDLSVSNADLIELVMKESPCIGKDRRSRNATSTRVSKGRTIFKAGRERDALTCIARSSRIPDVAYRARELLAAFAQSMEGD